MTNNNNNSQMTFASLANVPSAETLTALQMAELIVRLAKKASK